MSPEIWGAFFASKSGSKDTHGCTAFSRDNEKDILHLASVKPMGVFGLKSGLEDTYGWAAFRRGNDKSIFYLVPSDAHYAKAR